MKGEEEDRVSFEHPENTNFKKPSFIRVKKCAYQRWFSKWDITYLFYNA